MNDDNAGYNNDNDDNNLIILMIIGILLMMIMMVIMMMITVVITLMMIMIILTMEIVIVNIGTVIKEITTEEESIQTGNDTDLLMTFGFETSFPPPLSSCPFRLVCLFTRACDGGQGSRFIITAG